MQRVKTFVATGLAPDGRLYAGDLNAMQDAAAALTDPAQNIRLATVGFGDPQVVISKFGPNELQVGGKLRSTGILRGLGGILVGEFTSADLAALTEAPARLIVWNTSNLRYEFNAGTDGARDWRPLSQKSAGELFDLAHGVLPPQALWCNGAAYAIADYPRLHAVIGNQWDTFGGHPVPGAGLFRVPDLRGRGRVTLDMTGGPVKAGAWISRASGLALLVGAEFHALTVAQMPSHSHTANTGNQSVDHTHTGTTGTESADHLHSGTTAGRNTAHAHNDVGHSHSGQFFRDNAGTAPSTGEQGGNNAMSGIPTGFANIGTETTDHVHTFNTGGRNTPHTHSFTSSGVSTNHTHPIPAEGGGGSHENTHPVATVYTAIATG